MALNAPSIERADIFDLARSHRERQKLAEEYSRGYLKGWRECFGACVQAVEEEIAAHHETWDLAALLGDDLSPPRKN